LLASSYRSPEELLLTTKQYLAANHLNQAGAKRLMCAFSVENALHHLWNKRFCTCLFYFGSAELLSTRWRALAQAGLDL
jgi:hypothetical protein